jgi:hypothetical protein
MRISPGRDPHCVEVSYYMSTGPYSLGSGQIDNAINRYQTIPVNYWFRPLGHSLSSYLEIDGDFQKLVSGQWVPLANSDWSLNAYDESGALICAGIITGEGTVRRTITFDVGTYPKIIATIIIDLGATSTAATYRVTGSAVASTTINPLTSYVSMPILTSGNWYAVESTGGPWYYNPGTGAWSYDHAIFDNGTLIGLIGHDYTGVDRLLLLSADCPYGERTSVNYGRLYFKYASDFGIGITDSNYTDNHGDLVVYYSPAEAISGPDRRIVVHEMNLYNVCEVI